MIEKKKLKVSVTKNPLLFLSSAPKISKKDEGKSYKDFIDQLESRTKKGSNESVSLNTKNKEIKVVDLKGKEVSSCKLYGALIDEVVLEGVDIIANINKDMSWELTLEYSSSHLSEAKAKKLLKKAVTIFEDLEDGEELQSLKSKGLLDLVVKRS